MRVVSESSLLSCIFRLPTNTIWNKATLHGLRAPFTVDISTSTVEAMPRISDLALDDASIATAREEHQGTGTLDSLSATAVCVGGDASIRAFRPQLSPF